VRARNDDSDDVVVTSMGGRKRLCGYFGRTLCVCLRSILCNGLNDGLPPCPKSILDGMRGSRFSKARALSNRSIVTALVHATTSICANVHGESKKLATAEFSINNHEAFCH